MRAGVFLRTRNPGFPSPAFNQKRLLDKRKIEQFVAAFRGLNSRHPTLAEKIRTEADYFETNAERMRYPEFRSQHLFVGSGAIEAVARR